ncbi:Ig-like domain-containing protein [Thioflexithrix psekupsensis]|uniref:Big-1 domain-containing protein n=1 Tax=Thioflexithrix psekupsensis TaxID=1570016 RepID=A0A251X729_9GAMM|nr:Ig-like domain-containing protein [Thioflexithrix psekupsensis]OUD13879.1 hypothetical protein TPSD3_05905 [Thioflexithrix psekupsensis]
MTFPSHSMVSLLCYSLFALLLTGCLGGGGGSGDTTPQENNTVRLINNQVPADGRTEIQLTVISRHPDGTLRAGAAVALAPQSDNAVFSALSGVSDANGRFTVTVTNTVAETFTVNAFIEGNLVGNASLTFTPVQQLVSITVTNDEQPADGSSPIQFSVTVRDDKRLGVSGAEIQLAADSDTVRFSEVSGVTDAAGHFTTRIINTVAETVEVVVRVNDQEYERRHVTFISSSQRVALSVSPEQVLANDRDEATLTMIARQENNTPLANVPITLATESNTASFSTLSGVTDQNGRLQITVRNRVAETVVVNAFIGKEPVGSARVTFVAEKSGQFSVDVNPSNPIANGQSATTLTVIVRKTDGTASANTPIEFSTPSNTLRLSQMSGRTDANGRLAITATNTVAETATVRVLSNGVEVSTARLTFVNAEQRVVLHVTDNQQAANGQAAITIAAIARKTDGSALSGLQIELAAGSNSALFSALSGVTDNNGRFTVTVTNRQEETFSVKALVNGQTAAEAQLIFLNPTASRRVQQVDLVVTDNFRPANGVSQITLTVSARGANNEPLSDIPVSLESDSTSALFRALSGTTDKEGIFRTTVVNSQAETFKVTAIADGVRSQTVEISFAALTTVIDLTADRTLVGLGGTIQVTATLRGEPFEKLENGVFVTRYRLLPNTPASVSVSGSATLGQVPTVSDINGQVIFTVSSQAPERVLVRVNSGSISQTIELFFGALLSLIPQSINTIVETELTALLKDGNNAPLADQNIEFSFVNSNHESLSSRQVKTAADGTAKIKVTDVANDGGQAIVRASAGGLTADAEVFFQANFQEGRRRLAISSTATVLTVQQTATITAKITDDKGLPISGQDIEIKLSDLNGQPSPAQLSASRGVSDAQGEWSVRVNSPRGANVRVTVQAATAQQTLPLYFGASVRLTPPAERASVASLVRLTAYLSDFENVGIAGVPLNFRLGSGEALLDPFRVNTDRSGQAMIEARQYTMGDSEVLASADALPAARSQLTFFSNQTETIELSRDVTEVAINGKATITAIARDAQNNPMPAGTPLRFFTDGMGTITPEVITDQAGQAQAVFTADTRAGTVTISVEHSGTVARTTINVLPTSAGLIEVASIEPATIGIADSGAPETSLITFRVKDGLGNQVSDGTAVRFSLSKTRLNGGEALSVGQEFSQSELTAYTNHQALVAVTLRSGSVAGGVDVIAQVEKVSTTARVLVVGGLPDGDRLSLAAERLNIAGGVRFGIQNKVTAYVSDRFGNIVPDGTRVSFVTEGGTIGTSIGTGAFSETTQWGQATAVLQTANPAPPLLGGLPTSRHIGQSILGASYECSGRFALVSNPTVGSSLCGNPGLSTVVAYTTGSESFIDANGNGVFDFDVDRHTELGYTDANGNRRWDFGEIITGRGDLSEPYIEANDNGTYDDGEFYIDVNGNGRFDGPDGVYQNSTVIWRAMRILFSDRPSQLIVTLADGQDPNHFSIPVGGSLRFVVQSVADQWGNRLVGGTRFTVSTTAGILGGTTELVFEDGIGRGHQNLVFTLASEVQTSTEAPPPEPRSATITVRIAGAEDSGGSVEVSFSGGINGQ